MRSPTAENEELATAWLWLESGADFARKRHLLVLDRFLARVVDVFGGAVTFKGGLILELRRVQVW